MNKYDDGRSRPQKSEFGIPPKWIKIKHYNSPLGHIWPVCPHCNDHLEKEDPVTYYCAECENYTYSTE